MSNLLELAALDGANPLGFLAALGTLVTLSEDDPLIRLAWRDEAHWIPQLTSPGPLGKADVLRRLATTLRGKPVDVEKEKARNAAQKDFEAASTRLKKGKDAFKRRALRGNARTSAYTIEIKPLEQELDLCRKEFLGKLNDAVQSPELSIGKKVDLRAEEFRAKARQFLDENTGSLSAVTMLAALAVEGGTGDRSPRTDFDFVDSSGRLAFLETARQLMLLATEERLDAALFKPWQRIDERWSLRFDPIEDRRYALLDRDPTAGDNKSRSEWMANLLAYRALGLFPCVTTRIGPATVGWDCTVNKSRFTWPIWQAPLKTDTIRSLLSHAALLKDEIPSWLRTLGIPAIYRARRIANGDYINFSPPCGV